MADDSREGPTVESGKAPTEIGTPGSGIDHASRITPTAPMAYALRYASRGLRVMWAPRGMKRPVVKDWPKAATTDPVIVGQWWSEHPDANVCIATGPASGIWVLDVDDKDGHTGSATLAALERQHGGLPLTFTVGTGSGGVHHYFSHAGVDFPLGNSAGRLGDGLDTRGNGGQVVAPPSRADDPSHFMQYVVLLDIDPVPAPAWLLDLLRPKATYPHRTTPPPPADPGARERLAAALRARRGES
ncbi:bifunctional DNA primase/polymerase [Streptomyces sp. NBC_01481]|uniref:bifunctional DNA primase/polymerase n=1 Tax=Streptomyces sp. NBC_01481 TaxID=2975869 RepID=UPI00224F2219|nr:bifunctional DNA primase/polymerase [Streptomyces sp. NBC_01481]MCX4587473.1 bifunctional DNA primase/polymerase [Streptomyces sp. NBC_01481]